MIVPPKVAPSVVIKHKSGYCSEADLDHFFFTALAAIIELHTSIGIMSDGVSANKLFGRSPIELRVASISRVSLCTLWERY